MCGVGYPCSFSHWCILYGTTWYNHGLLACGKTSKMNDSSLMPLGAVLLTVRPVIGSACGIDLFARW